MLSHHADHQHPPSGSKADLHTDVASNSIPDSKQEIGGKGDGLDRVVCGVLPRPRRGPAMRLLCNCAVELQHGISALDQLHTETPRVAQHCQAVTRRGHCDVAVGRGAGVDQALAVGLDIRTAERHVQQQRIPIAVLGDVGVLRFGVGAGFWYSPAIAGQHPPAMMRRQGSLSAPRKYRRDAPPECPGWYSDYNRGLDC